MKNSNFEIKNQNPEFKIKIGNSKSKLDIQNLHARVVLTHFFLLSTYEHDEKVQC